MKKIDTIVFDLGGVLINLDKQACIDAFRALGFAEVEQYLGEYEQQGIFGKLEAGKISPAEFRNGVRSAMGQEVNDQEIDTAFNAFLLDLPLYKLEMLRELKKSYRIVMLSNTNAIMFDFICDTIFRQEGLTVHHYFDDIFVSHEMGCTKPNRYIYEQLIAKAGIVPEQTLYVEDSAANLEAAAPFGFKTLLVEPYEDFRERITL